MSVKAAFDRLATELTELSRVKENAIELVDSGFAPLLVKLILTESRTAALCSLAWVVGQTDDAHRDVLLQAGALKPLVAVLTDSKSRQPEMADAASALSDLAWDSARRSDAIVAVHAIEPLVALLAGDADGAARYAAEALGRITTSSYDGGMAIACAGAMEPLVALVARGGESEAAGAAALALACIVRRADADAALAAGAIEPLVALLAGGTEPDGGAERAASALAHVAQGSFAGAGALVAAGAIEPLVALLAGGDESQGAVEEAADALSAVCFCSEDRAALILDAIYRARPRTPPSAISIVTALMIRLRDTAIQAMKSAYSRSDPSALATAIERGELLVDDGSESGYLATTGRKLMDVLQAARTSRGELLTAKARQALLESAGLSAAPPCEFQCPLTLTLMSDPVVASDGFSYERTAIARVLAEPNARSPLTREVLRPELLPNRALRKHIEVHKTAQDALVEQLKVCMGRATEAEEAKAEAQAKAEALRKELEEYKAAGGIKREESAALKPEPCKHQRRL